jgi:stage V sporulation protein SpoVS
MLSACDALRQDADVPTPVRTRIVARCVAAAVCIVLPLCVAGCSTAVDGAARVDPADASAYRSAEASASAERARSDADYSVCSGATAAAAAMLSAYNSFVTALNEKQEYASLEGADLDAISALDRGTRDIRGSLAATNSDGVRSAAAALADRSGALAGVIRAKGRTELNTASSGFLRARDGVLAACRSFTVPASGAPSSSAPRTTPR